MERFFSLLLSSSSLDMSLCYWGSSKEEGWQMPYIIPEFYWVFLWEVFLVVGWNREADNCSCWKGEIFFSIYKTTWHVYMLSGEFLVLYSHNQTWKLGVCHLFVRQLNVASKIPKALLLPCVFQGGVKSMCIVKEIRKPTEKKSVSKIELILFYTWFLFRLLETGW